MFCSVDIRPADSCYYTDDVIASIQGRCLDSDAASFVVGGDLNARCGAAVNSLVRDGSMFVYEGIQDSIPRPNDTGKKVLQLCDDCNMVIVTNLQTNESHFQGALSFRKKIDWISELDLILISNDVVNAVSYFKVDQDVRFPSDHAPVSMWLNMDALGVDDVEALTARSRMLGEQWVPLRPSSQHVDGL